MGRPRKIQTEEIEQEKREKDIRNEIQYLLSRKKDVKTADEDSDPKSPKEIIEELKPLQNKMSKKFKEVLTGQNRSFYRAAEVNWKEKFLDALRNTANVRLACQAAGVSRLVALREKDKDPEFDENWEMALEDATDILEGVAFRRAKDGSDYLLTFLLRALRPQTYREQKYIPDNNPQGLALLELMKTADTSRGFNKTQFVDADIVYSTDDNNENKAPVSNAVEVEVIGGSSDENDE